MRNAGNNFLETLVPFGSSHSSFSLHPSSISLPLSAAFMTPALAIAGAALVAIPILIHLLNRRRYKTVQWAAMTFVLAALRRNRKRMRFESWLLLAMRCLVIGLAGIALARPLGCTDSSLASAIGREGGLHVLVLDNSLSTRQSDADGADDAVLFDRIKASAAAVIASLGSGGGRVIVLTAGSPTGEVIAAPSYDLDAATAAIHALTPTLGRGDLASALERAAAAVEETAGGDSVTFHIFGDAAVTSIDDPRLVELGPRLVALGVVWVYRPSDAAPANAGVLSLRPTDTLFRRGFDVQLTANAAQFAADGSEWLATWSIDGRIATSAPITLSAEFSAVTATADVIDAIADGRPHVVSLGLQGDEDALADDNIRRRVVEQVRELPVLLVGGRRDGSGALAGTAILEAALSPGDGGYVSVTRVSDLELGGRRLGEFRAVILAGVGGIDEIVAEQIARYVRSGGTLIQWLGETTTADNDNRRLLPRGLLPGTLGRRVRADESQTGDDDIGLFRFDLDPRRVHSFLAAFSNADRSGLDAPAVRQYWQVTVGQQVLSEITPEVVLSFAGTGDPAVITHALGAGRVVTITTAAADPDWSVLPIKTNYPAFVHELLRNAVGSVSGGGGTDWQTLTVGDILSIPTTIDLPAGSVPRLNGGAEARSFERRGGADATIQWTLTGLDQPGSFEITAGELRLPVVVNVPAEESDLRRASDSEIAGALGEIDVTFGDLMAGGEAFASDDLDRPDWGWPILAIVLLLAGCETVYAAYLGRMRQ